MYFDFDIYFISSLIYDSIYELDTCFNVSNCYLYVCLYTMISIIETLRSIGLVNYVYQLFYLQYYLIH